jgi:putative transposase
MSFYQLLQSFPKLPSLPFADLLSEEVIQRIARESDVSLEDESNSDIKYTTSITLWAFLSQVLFTGPQQACRAAVSRVIALCIALQRVPPSADTGAYCRACQRLPLTLIEKLTHHTADTAEQQTPQHWLWKNRHVHLVDGTTLSTPDTHALQQHYPQPKSQKPGLGFPMIRMVMMMSLATAMVTGWETGPQAGKETGETALFRKLLARLSPGDIVLADRYYCSYFLIALMQEFELDVVLRLHQRRQADFRRGTRLGSGDHLVTWHRPKKPNWMSQEMYDRMPKSLSVREISVTVSEPGYRTDSLIVVTTLLDANVYTKQDVSELYHKRWLIELDIRSWKVSLNLSVLRSKSPDMILKEIAAAMLAYNLLRQSLMQAAQKTEELSPRQLSFTAALQATASVFAQLPVVGDAVRETMVTAQLGVMGSHRIGDRPGRVEPRANKRRPKVLALLTQPRAEARAALLAGTAKKNP